ncbi:MAG: hotdog fold thioesterase [Bacteroidia bacterium]
MEEIALLEYMNSKLPGSLGESIGMQFTLAREGYLEAQMPVDQRTIQPYGILHGGASVALAETLGSVGANMLAGEGKVAVGLEINANHIRPVRSGLVTGKASILHKGRTTQVWDIKIFDETEHLVCVCRFTAAIVNNRS